MHLYIFFLFLFGGQFADTRPATVEGLVLRAGTNEPLSKARVELYPDSVGTPRDYDYNPAMREFAKSRGLRFLTTTNSQGRFTFTEIPAGRYRLTVTRDGFVQQEYGQRGLNDSGMPLDVLAGSTTSDLSMRLQPAPTISGTVYDDSDNPVAWATVDALEVSYRPGGGRQLRPVQTVQTNARGEYRLFWLGPGDYYIQVNYNESVRYEIIPGIPQVNPNIPAPEAGYPTFYHPSTTDIQAAAAVRLRDASVAAIDFKLHHAQAATVSGTVTNIPPGGRPGDVQMGLFSQTILIAGAFRVRPDAAGNFTIPNVAPGSYILRALHTPANRRMESRAIPIDVAGKNVEGVAVTLLPPIPVSGRFVMEGGLGPPPFDLTGAIVRLNGRFGPLSSINLIVEGDGSFRSQPGFGASGDYEVVVFGLPPGMYIKHVLIGSRDVIESGLTLLNDPPPPLEIVLASHSGLTSGTVTNSDDTPIAGAIVVLIPASERLRSRNDRYYRATTDGSGRFAIRSAAPGEYTALAFEELARETYYDPEFLARHAARGERITIEENAGITIDLRGIPGEGQ